MHVLFLTRISVNQWTKKKRTQIKPEQCVTAHLECNASRKLLHNIRKHGEFLPNTRIDEIEYLDPFEVSKEW